MDSRAVLDLSRAWSTVEVFKVPQSSGLSKMSVPTSHANREALGVEVKHMNIFVQEFYSRGGKQMVPWSPKCVNTTITYSLVFHSMVVGSTDVLRLLSG